MILRHARSPWVNVIVWPVRMQEQVSAIVSSHINASAASMRQSLNALSLGKGPTGCEDMQLSVKAVLFKPHTAGPWGLESTKLENEGAQLFENDCSVFECRRIR